MRHPQAANLGSTRLFKYRLFDMSSRRQLLAARRHRADRLAGKPLDGRDRQTKSGNSRSRRAEHVEAVHYCLAQLTLTRALAASGDAAEVSAIAFKTVHGGRYSGVQRVTPDVLAAMEEFWQAVASHTHNPPYIAAMRETWPRSWLRRLFPARQRSLRPISTPLIPEPQLASTPFLTNGRSLPASAAGDSTGASNRYIAGRTAELLGRGDLRIISCHLGEARFSLCRAIRNRQSCRHQHGNEPAKRPAARTANRVGDIGRLRLAADHGIHGQAAARGSLGACQLRAHLLGMSGVSFQLPRHRRGGSRARAMLRAKLALDVFAASVRHYLGAYLVQTRRRRNAIVFTGGIGENGDAAARPAVCRDLAELGIVLDPAANEKARGENADSRTVKAASKSGSCPPTRKSSLPVFAADLRKEPSHDDRQSHRSRSSLRRRSRRWSAIS